MQTEILEAELSDDTKEVAVTVSGYVAKKLVKRSKCSVCPSKLISKDHHIANDSYLAKHSRGGLVCPGPALSDFVSRAFSLLGMINPVIQKVSNDVPLRLIAEKSLQHIQTGFVYFTCPEYEN